MRFPEIGIVNRSGSLGKTGIRAKPDGSTRLLPSKNFSATMLGRSLALPII